MSNKKTMAHKEQMEFVGRIKKLYSYFFIKCRVLEVGSYNINGTVKIFFEDCQYIGIDVCPGPDVDIVCPGQDYKDDSCFDTIITCEMLEHNLMWKETLLNIIKLLRSGGLLIITCATTGRGIHGTSKVSPKNSPSHAVYGEYYRNIDERDIREIINMSEIFDKYSFEVNDYNHDLYMWGIKA